MRIYMKDGTTIEIQEKTLGDAKANFEIQGYICIEHLDRPKKVLATRVVIPKENVSFIDMENDDESGLTMKIYPHID